MAIKKFIKLGVRPSLIPLLASYLTDRKMKVKFNNEVSDFLTLIGGGPQGTLIGGIEYLIQSNDNADIVPEEDRFKYIDDLSVLELVMMTGLLKDYNFYEHVASDIGIGQSYLPPASYSTQGTLDKISAWTIRNMMLLNEGKSNYIIFSRSQEQFATRLTLNNVYLDMSWDRNTREICLKAYAFP